MPDIASIIQNGVVNPWLYLPLAVLLGALHALEPGHSKSLMAAFIVAIRGTARQAVLLGVSAAVGHTIVVWGLAALGLWLGDRLILDKAEPWLILLSGLLIIALAVRLMASVHGGIAGHQHRDHGHDHHHDHGHDHHHPHDHHHGEDADAHAAAHARDIEQRFAGRRDVTQGEIVWFGFTGGLLPCPAALAVLLVCLQLKAVTLGIAMVAAFSIGLAVTLVLVGLLAAWGSQQFAARSSGYDRWSRRLPYISGALVMLVGTIIAVKGLMAVVAA